MKLIRVFPRRTSFTPDDPYVFIGYPTLWLPDADEVHVSVTFTWDIPEAQRLVDAWSQHYAVVKIGGPAFGDVGGEFTPGMYVKQGVTFTSRGCIRHCPWCLVPSREGSLRLLDIKPGWILQDNNILATPKDHQMGVYAMLRTQRKAATFSGGIDARLVDDWTAEQFRALRIKEVFLAADTEASLKPLKEATDLLGFLGRYKLRCYVMVGRNETIAQARERLEAVWQSGCLPFCQLYRPADHEVTYSHEWRALQREWARPAAMVTQHKDRT
jgi:hypothetical protein